MTVQTATRWTTPRDENLGLAIVKGGGGLRFAALPNGALYSIEHRGAGAPVCVGQILGSAVAGAIARVLLRIEGEAPLALPCPDARFGAGADRFVWEREAQDVCSRLTLAPQPHAPGWIWRLDVENRAPATRTMDALLIQDLGLGPRGFLMNNEAYASQYIDHFIAAHERFGPVVMSRQNLEQEGSCPFVMHGCLDGAASFATDGKDVFGPSFRDASAFALRFGEDLPGRRLQHEMACAAIQSRPLRLGPGERASFRFFALFAPDQPVASSAADLARLDAMAWRDADPAQDPKLAPVAASLVERAPVARADRLEEDEIAALYPERFEEERTGGRLMSFFAPDGGLNRHVVLRDKELLVTRRHGAILRSGAALLPDEATLCATCWMHGVFAAQLTLGNTSFHKLFTVSRDPYNVTRASGLRILIEIDGAWRLLAAPSAFEMGLSDCRWLYRFGARTVSVRAIVSGEDAAMIWRVEVLGEALRFLAFGQLALGEREYECESPVEIDAGGALLRPDPSSLWAQRYPDASLRLVSETPDEIEAMGGQELLFSQDHPRGGGFLALRSRPTRAVSFSVTGSLTSAAQAGALAGKYRAGVSPDAALAPARAFWRGLMRGARITGAPALDALAPWLAHDAMIHLTVPHGLEQYTGAAWGVRDVCQGPIELLLALRHDEAAREILRRVLAQQYQDTGDWPQWFMFEPYEAFQDRTSHGDVIVWPLKAVCDYIEETGDGAFLDEPVAWRDRETLRRTPRADSALDHLDRLIDAACARFVPKTHLIRYGEGDWNDSLQPVDPAMRERMVSSWTVALLYQQLRRFAAILARFNRADRARKLEALAGAMAADFRACLMPDGVIAGYGVFGPDGLLSEVLLHPRDARTGLRYSLLPMERAIAAGLLTEEETQAHLALIREHLLYPDGARLTDRPVAYRGGPQTIFRRAESASFFGREIGLMYVHEHLRFAELLAMRGEGEAFFATLEAVNPVSVGALLPAAQPRQRNAFFSSSDAAFPDRAAASADWDALRRGDIGVEGGWRIYSSGPGIFVSLLIRRGFGRRRCFGAEARGERLGEAALSWDLDAV